MKEILTRYYVGLFIVAFLVLVLFTGVVKALLFAAAISIAKYFFDKYVMEKLNPFIDKVIEWIKSKFTKTT